jgi:SAM-dependent methyltransferase
MGDGEPGPWGSPETQAETDEHYRSRYAVPIPSAYLRAASSLADLGMWMAIGEPWAQVALHFVPSDEPVVADIGCRCGKMARFLLAHPRLRYVGLDVFRPAVDWAQPVFQAIYGERAIFRHVDVYSALYNRSGSLSGVSVKLPIGDAAVDLAIGASLFTHLLEPEMHHYLAEIARVLRSGGRLLASIHNEPPTGRAFSGDVTRIDMTDERFIESASRVGLAVHAEVGNLYSQQTYVFERR